MSLTKEQIEQWRVDISEWLHDYEQEPDVIAQVDTLCDMALRSLDSPVSAITAHPDPLDIRSYGFDEPDVDGTKEWIERMGGIFGETFKGLAEAHPAMIVRQMAKLVIAQARAAAPVAQEAVVEMALCEIPRLILKEGTTYRFKKMHQCKLCQDYERGELPNGPSPEETPKENWIGCGECDIAFHCHDGRSPCVRLAASKKTASILAGALDKATASPEEQPIPDCLHAAPHRYCAKCAVTPCPIGMGHPMNGGTIPK